MIEYAALIVFAAIILGGLVALGLPGKVRSGVTRGLCEIFHPSGSSGCASSGGKSANGRNPYKPTKACVVSSSSSRYGGDVAVSFVDVGGGVTLVEQTDSKGHVTVTATADKEADLVAGAGLGFNGGSAVNVGGDANASGGITTKIGDSWTFDNQKEADNFTREIQKNEWATEGETSGIPPVQVASWAYKRSPWKPKVPSPDVTRYSEGLNVTGTVNAGAGVGPGKKSKSKGGKNSGGKSPSGTRNAGTQQGGKHAPGKHAPGKHEAPGESARNAGRSGYSPASGSAQVTVGNQATVEVDHKHHTYAATVEVYASATANGQVAGKSPGHPEGGATDGAVKVTTDSHGNVIGVDMTQTVTINGKTTVTTSHLPVTDANRSRVIKDLGIDYAKGVATPTHLTWDDLAPTEDPGKAGDDFQREMYQHAQTTKTTYDTSSGSNSLSGEAKAGVELGLTGSHDTQSQKLTGAQYLGPPGPDGKRHYRPWKACTK